MRSRVECVRRTRPGWVVVGALLGGCLVIAIGGSAQASEAPDFAVRSAVAATGDLGQRTRQGASGFRCETRNRPREVSRRNFVIDRVTECIPLWFEEDASESEEASTQPIGEDELSDLAPPLSQPLSQLSDRDRADRRAVWSSDRSRFGNAQHDRSLRAMRGMITRVRR